MGNTERQRKWATVALSATLRKEEMVLSQDMRNIIADRLDNQVVEIKQLSNVIERGHENNTKQRLTITIAKEHLKKNRPTCALAKLKGTCEEAEDMLIEMAMNP